MVEVFLSKTHPNIFHVQFSGIITAEDDSIYWEDYFKPFLQTKKSIIFVQELLPDCQIVDESFFNESTMDKLDVKKELKEFVYLGLVGIQKYFFYTYIKNFPCDYTLHSIYDVNQEYYNDHNVDFDNEFKSVFKFVNKKNESI